MRGAERVVDVHVRVARPAPARTPRRWPPRPERSAGSRAGRSSPAFRSLTTLRAPSPTGSSVSVTSVESKSARRSPTGIEGVLRDRPCPWAPEVRSQHHTCPLLDRVLDGRQALADPRVVRDRARRRQGHVEVDTDEDAAARDVHLGDGLNGHFRFAIATTTGFPIPAAGGRLQAAENARTPGELPTKNR